MSVEKFLEAVLKAREMGCFEEFEDILAQGEGEGFLSGVPEGDQGTGGIIKLKEVNGLHKLSGVGMVMYNHHYSGNSALPQPLPGALQYAQGVSSTSVPGTGLNKDATNDTTLHGGAKVVRTYVSGDFHELLKTLKFATGLTFPEITDIVAMVLLNDCKNSFEKAFGLRWEQW